MRTSLATLSFALLLAAPALATAQNAPPAPWAPPTVRAQRPDVHRHDGFYLRLATGFGSHFETINQDGHDPGLTVQGSSVAGEFAVGWAVRPGVILGLGAYSSTVQNSERTYDDSNPMPPAEIVGKVDDFSIFGPFCDWYFNSRRGLHLQSALGLATVHGMGLRDGRNADDNVALGPGFMIGVGYDWWIAEQWSLGILGRVSVAVATGEDDSGVRWEHAIGTAPSLLFTATFN